MNYISKHFVIKISYTILNETKSLKYKQVVIIANLAVVEFLLENNNFQKDTIIKRI